MLPLENRLIAKQISPTAMRLLVLGFLEKQTAAVTLADVETGVEHSDRVTLYRTIKTFEKKGLVHSIKDGTVTKYALCEADCEAEQHADTHLHYYCTSCKATFCLPKVKIPGIELPEGFAVQEISLIARGLCDRCKAKAV